MRSHVTFTSNPHADRQIPWATHLQWGQWILSPAQGRMLAVILLSLSDLVPGTGVRCPGTGTVVLSRVIRLLLTYFRMASQHCFVHMSVSSAVLLCSTSCGLALQ